MGTIYRNGKVNTIIKNGKVYGFASGGGEGEKIKYISSTGSQYVTLPVKANDNNILKIQLKCLCLSENNATILGSSFSGNSAYLLYASKSSGNLIYKYAIANNYTYIDFPRSTQFDDIELGYDYVKINGTTYSETGSAIHSDTGYINVFGTPSGYYSECLISEIKIFMNDVLTYHLVPFVNSNNVPCFKDILNNVEYTSATSSQLVYGELKVGGVEEILSGTTTPTSAQGSNGQIYLKYDEYDYDTFMNDKIIVQINKNDNTDKKLFFVGLEKDTNDISITDNDLLSYLSDVTNGYKKAGYSYSQNQVQNGNIGFYNLGDGVKLRSWSIDWTTLGSGTYYSLLDLNEPATSASESSGQTNIYIPSYYDSSNIISSAYLKVNNTWQNLTGSNIDDVGNTNETVTYIDMSNITKVGVTSSMNYIPYYTSIISTWNSGSAIAANGYITTPIDVTNINKLYYELETKNCWGNGSQALQDRWKVMVGLMQTPITSAVEVPFDQAGFSAGEDFAYSNTNYGTQEIDVSNLTGNYYFTFVTHGWNAMISNLRYE